MLLGKEVRRLRFVISFSGGKDSMLALHKMVEAGHRPMGLLVMMNEAAGRSWFHGVDPALLRAISDALGIPLMPCPAEGEGYHTAMEARLREAQAAGAQACVFGDIDIQPHLEWDRARCAAAGLEPVLPLWGRDRRENVREAVALGYECVIKCLDRDLLPERLLGRALSEAVLDEMEGCGVDLCGENGEYHTVVLDGPLFRRPVAYERREILRFGHISAMDITAAGGGGETEGRDLP